MYDNACLLEYEYLMKRPVQMGKSLSVISIRVSILILGPGINTEDGYNYSEIFDVRIVNSEVKITVNKNKLRGYKYVVLPYGVIVSPKDNTVAEHIILGKSLDLHLEAWRGCYRENERFQFHDNGYHEVSMKNLERTTTKNRSFIDLTDDEISEAVNAIFSPTRIEKIERDDDTIYVSIVTERAKDETGSDYDKIELMDPWLYGKNSIWAYGVSERERTLLKQFCYAHGVRGWLEDDNPFLKKEAC